MIFTGRFARIGIIYSLSAKSDIFGSSVGCFFVFSLREVMRQVNVIRHLAFEDLGSFAGVFESRGMTIRYLEAGVDGLDQLDPADDDLLIILGGPISANDSDDFPFISTEIMLLAERIQHDKPTLGICLGAQLIARAMRASVYPATQKEIGWAPVQLTAAGQSSALGKLAGSAFQVLHWHGETFDLPEGASLLASTGIAENQAFRLGANVYGLQFHIEVTRQGMEKWFIGHIGEIEQTTGISVSQLRADTERYGQQAEQAAKHFLTALMADMPA